MKSSRQTFFFAPEIEESMTSLCWRDPDLFEQFTQSHDFTVLIAQRHCQDIFKAMHLAYETMGTLDWASVVQSCRELGSMDEVGGIDGLNRVYTMIDTTKYCHRVFDSYLSLLETYAEGRAHTNEFGDPTPRQSFVFSDNAINRAMKQMEDVYKRHKPEQEKRLTLPQEITR